MDKARELFMHVKIMDVDCAVIRVYHAQLEYLMNRMKAMEILSEATDEGTYC